MGRSVRVAVIGVLAAALGWTAVQGPASAAPSYPPFPASGGAAHVERWLANQTDLPLGSVVLVGPGYVFAFIAPDPPSQGNGLIWKQVREEVTDLSMVGRMNGRSAIATVAFDCRRNQATASDVIVYGGNSLQGQPGRAVPAAEWLVANPGLYLMDLAKAACDPAFHRPYELSQASALTGEPDPTPSINEPPARPVARESGAEHWAQIGAFASPAAAGRRWREIQRLAPTQSTGRGLRTELVGAGKTLVRALVGPFHGVSAHAFCTVIKAHGGDCIVH